MDGENDKVVRCYIIFSSLKNEKNIFFLPSAIIKHVCFTKINGFKLSNAFLLSF